MSKQEKKERKEVPGFLRKSLAIFEKEHCEIKGSR
jgi:hypothetical protein